MFAKNTTKFKRKKLFSSCFTELHQGFAELHKVFKKKIVNLSGILCGSLWNKQKNGNSA